MKFGRKAVANLGERSEIRELKLLLELVSRLQTIE